MTLAIYQNESTPKRLDKSNFLTTVGTISNVILQETNNILNPTFILAKNQTVLNGNYLYCDETRRYYYYDKNSIQKMTGGRISISAYVDVLHSFHEQIENGENLVDVTATEPDTESQLLEQPYYFRNDCETLSIDFPTVHFKDSDFNTNVVLIMAP